MRRLRRSTQIGFNLEVGGYFSIKRNAVSFDGDTFVRQDQVLPFRHLSPTLPCATCPEAKLPASLRWHSAERSAQPPP